MRLDEFLERTLACLILGNTDLKCEHKSLSFATENSLISIRAVETVDTDVPINLTPLPQSSENET